MSIFMVLNVLPCFSFCSNIPKMYHLSMVMGVRSVCFRGDFAIKAVVVFLRQNSLENLLGLYSRIWNLSCVSNCAVHPIPMQSDRYKSCSIVKLRGGCRSLAVAQEFAKWNVIYTPEKCAEERMQNNADLKLLCHERWHHVHFGGCAGKFATVIWRLQSVTVSFRGDVGGESGLWKLASVNRRTPHSMGTGSIYKKRLW